MADLLGRAMCWLERQRHRNLTVPVAYCRGTEVIRLRATVGRTVFETLGASGVLERTESRDFLVRASDLVLGGLATLPKRGDRLREVQRGTLYIYEVMAPGREPEWRWSDPGRLTLRIHTKQVDMEDAP